MIIAISMVIAAVGGCISYRSENEWHVLMNSLSRSWGTQKNKQGHREANIGEVEQVLKVTFA